MSRSVKSSAELKNLDSYELVKEEFVGDCKGLGLVFRHKKTKARVCVISNDDDNKVFCMAFKTPSRDDTGVAHILEHSVLCGSEKYPAKDPFMELEKGSLNTYLNAFTYPDKTCYPVASCNDKDFQNLCGVYVDAVLRPNIYSRKEIFMQEGWHYEIESKDAPLTVNGVVFNEMKGAFSSPESRILRSAIHAVFPDNEYCYESGGLPTAIPTLTYESFIDFHKTYYHPSNSYIYFYGDLDIEERLEWLDREYLSKYDYLEVDSSIGFQKPVGTKDITNYYPLGSEESEEDAAYLTWVSVAGDGAETEKLLAVSMVLDALFDIPGAPAKEALISAGVGQDISVSLYGELQQALVLLMASNTEADRMSEFKKIIKEQLEKAANEGINEQSLRAILNRMEFSQAEADFGHTPKGLVYIENSLSTWAYDDNDPFSTLNKLEIFENLKKKIGTGYYEQVIRECLLSDDNAVYITTLPSKTMGQEESDVIENRLAEIKKSLSDEQLEQIMAEQEHLKMYQSEPSTKEELESIPMLTREDIGMKIRPIIYAEDKFGDVPVVYHNYETNGIVYMKFLFDLAGVPEDKLYLLPMTMRLFGEMDTEKRSYLDLNNDINTHTGGVFMDVLTFPRRGKDKRFRPMMILETKAMENEVANVFPLINEFLFETDYSSKKRIREIIAEASSELKYTLNRSGHMVAINVARGNINPEHAYVNKMKGLSEKEFIDKAIKFTDEEIDALVADIKALLRGILGKDNMLVDINCNEKIYANVKSQIAEFAMAMKNTDGTCKAPEDKYGMAPTMKTEHRAYKNSGAVNYLALMGNYSECDEATNGKMAVLSQIISNEYLYNEIRVKGGAYGCGFIANTNGGVGGFYSYRDPHIKETLEVYKNTVDFLKNFEADDREMLKYIIGTVGAMDSPMGPNASGMRSLRLTLSGANEEMITELKKGTVSTTVEDIRSLAAKVEEILSEDNYCAVGSEAGVSKDQDMFEIVESLL